MLDLNNPSVQGPLLSASAVIISALLSAYITLYLHRREDELKVKISRKEELEAKAHQGLEETTLFVHHLAKAREEIRNEYEEILKNDRERLAKTEIQLEVYKAQLAQHIISITTCQEDHKKSVEVQEELRKKIKQNETYIKALQEDLTAAGIPIRLRGTDGKAI
jgi:hypothetical protein